MRVVVLERVMADVGRQRKQMERVERAQPGEVEDRAEVDVERIVALAGEDLDASAEALDRRRRECVVGRRRARPDVVGRRRQVVTEHDRLVLAAVLDLAVLLKVDERDVVRLRPVPARIVQRRDRPGVVEERVRVPRRGREAELVADVGAAVTVVVDLDLVQDAVVEAVEVRPAGRSFERDVVRDHRDGVRVVRTDERVQVGVVRPRVLADQRRLCVARCERAARAVKPRQDQEQSERDDSESHRDQDWLANGRKR